ncbi:MAG: FAD-dependent oxidoreductase [Desulfobacteraceae bacterium]
MFANNRIEVIIDRVDAVNREEKSLSLSDGRTISYDKLVFSTGSSPFIIPIPGKDLAGVFAMRTLVDAEKIRAYMEKWKPKKIVFIGAGFLNLEVATLMKQSDPDFYEMTVVEVLKHPLGLMLDAEMAAGVQTCLEENALTMRMGERVTRILETDGQVSGVELSSKETIDADMVFMNVGSRPNLALAEAMDLEMGEFGVQTNEYMETSDPDVFAGGDCVNNFHFITGKPTPIQLRGPAVIQGRLIAKRLAGYDIPFPGLLGNSAVKLFDKSIATTGFTEEEAANNGFTPVCTTVDSVSKHSMIPGSKPWTIKLVFDKISHKLLGGQIISDSDAPLKEIDTINALILGEKKITDLVTVMCAGNPDCASEPSKEPIAIAAEQALQKVKQ